MKSLLLFSPFLFTFSCSIAQVVPPLEKSGFSLPTSHSELTAYLSAVDAKSELITVKPLTQSVEGRALFSVFFSKGTFGADPAKIKVLFFAQQHGNEQSGKEGALLLINELQKPENQFLFDKMDFVLIPQMNPDGSEANKRRNGHDMDLNRNHLILTEPETNALHQLFNEWLFEASLDVHEYSPYGGEWEVYGYRRNFDEQLGSTTNPNVSEKIRSFSNEEALPFLKKYITGKNYSFNIYSPGGPPEKDLIRYSTFDINDGRQSLGIQNTFSFIQEGLNGEDNFKDNLKRRSEGQMTGMLGLLKFIYAHKDDIKAMVKAERAKLVSGEVSPKVAVQMDHFPDGNPLNMTLRSYSTGKDTVVTVKDFRPVVKSTFDVTRPKGYLIPKKLTELTYWVKRHNLEFAEYKPDAADQIEQYAITAIDTLNFEGDKTVNPATETEIVTGKINPDEYVFVPVNQLKNNLIVIALEPKSTLGLVTYAQFAHLLKKGEAFPVLRVTGTTAKAPSR